MYELRSTYNITREQKRAVENIVKKFKNGVERQVLLGVTGSGKTFTMANIIKELNIPTIVLSPNKTLAAQLYQEFKGFFPENRVGYFISYYDYYQPEAYVPQRNMYIAKEVSINPELERLRIDAARNILESQHTVVVASVSSIYSIGSPDDFFEQKMSYSLQSTIDRNTLMRELISLGYTRTEGFIEGGKFRVRGDIVEVFPTSEENPIRFVFVNDKKMGNIEIFDPVTAETLKKLDSVNVFPISYFYYKKSRVNQIVNKIEAELDERVKFFFDNKKNEYGERLKERTLFDIELLKQYGHCPGIENYSLYLTGREKGEPPYTLLDFFRQNYLTIIDESHITVPQLRGMYEGDRSRKETLVKFGFRLPSALDNRPLNFEEIYTKLRKVLYVSATPSEFEIRDSTNNVTELLVRPTGLVDPRIELKRMEFPIEDMMIEIKKEIKVKNRILVTTLTKRMSEKLTDYLSLKGIRCAYMHAEIKPLERVKIIKKLRTGDIDVLVGINLLREGLDLPEVSLVIILDADREGFLRTETSLIQTFGRASRNVNGRVILYLKKMTGSLKQAINESSRRRKYQTQYNKQNNIIPESIEKKIKDFYDDDYWIKKTQEDIKVNFKDKDDLLKEIDTLTKSMKERADLLDFRGASILRDKIKELKNLLIDFY